MLSGPLANKVKDAQPTLTDYLTEFDGVSLSVLAQRHGTPCFVYSASHCRAQYAQLESALASIPHSIYYSVKANSSLAILQLFADLGAGFDIVSGGELVRVLEAGGDCAKVLFSGVGKRVDEIDLALKVGIGCFNVESAAELVRIEERAGVLNRVAPISIRVNPEVDAKTHPYISTALKENKFGVPTDLALELYRHAAISPLLEVRGIDCHIGSQITRLEPFRDALTNLLELVDRLAAEGISIAHLDLGGGLGISYDGTAGLDPQEYGNTVAASLQDRNLHFIIEPGRFLVGNAGLLLTRVEYLKPMPAPGYRNFAIVDVAMNDLLRPALYQAWHNVSLVESPTTDSKDATMEEVIWDLVGPICETGDFIAKDRKLALTTGTLLAIHSVGAYGMALSSNYNSRPRAPEILVDSGQEQLIRARETMTDMLGPERIALRQHNATQTSI